jgi:hypothetical protein
LKGNSSFLTLALRDLSSSAMPFLSIAISILSAMSSATLTSTSGVGYLTLSLTSFANLRCRSKSLLSRSK